MVTIIIWGLQRSGNLGAICRIMKNFGFAKLILIEPKCKPGSVESKNRAKHAQDVLQNLKVRDSGCLKRFDTVIGTTSKIGSDYNISRCPVNLRSVKVANNTAILFGCEKEGLRNDQISMCDYVVSIPTNKLYPSLNLSHAVGIFLYELSNVNLADHIADHISEASRGDKNQIMKMLDDAMIKLKFGSPEKMETQRLVWKRLISKSGMTKREAFSLMGLLRKIK